MSIPLIINGVTFQYPQQFDTNWAPTLTNWSTAVTNGMLQKAGGSFPLTADVNFGTSFGVLSKYFISTSANVAASGCLRLSNTDVIAFRNGLNNADILLNINSSNQLVFNGSVIAAATSLTDGQVFIGNASNLPIGRTLSGAITTTNTGVTTLASNYVVDSMVNSSAAITLSKLATVGAYNWLTGTSGGVINGTSVTASRAVATDSNGLPVASSTTATELGYVHGVTSAIQTQLSSITSSYLPRVGGAMTSSLDRPSGITLSITGSTGTKAYSYCVVAVDALGNTSGKSYTQSGCTTYVGNATLDGSHYITVSWASVSGAVSYNVYRYATSGTPSTVGKIASTASTTINDTGLAGDGTIAPASPSNGKITNITEGAATGEVVDAYQLNGIATTRIINGGFEWWTLGTPQVNPTNGTYTADGWNVQTGGGTPATWTVSQDTTNQDSGAACLKAIITGAGSGITNSLRIEQRIEDFTDYQGEIISVSVRIKTTLANHVRFVVDCGDDGAYSPYHTGSGNYETLTVTTQVAASIPLMRIKIGMTSADITTGTYYIDSVMFTISPYPLTYIPADPGSDMARRARLIQIGGDVSNPRFVYGLGYSDGTNYYVGGAQSFTSTMPGTPTVTLVGDTLSEDGSATNVIGSYTITAVVIDPNGFTAQARKAVAGSRPASFGFHWVAQYLVP